MSGSIDSGCRGFSAATKAICLLSGDHQNISPAFDKKKLLRSHTAIMRVSRDATSTIQSADLPSRFDAKAIFFPSGDHRGVESLASPVVSCVGWPPDAGTSQRFDVELFFSRLTADTV